MMDIPIPLLLMLCMFAFLMLFGMPLSFCMIFSSMSYLLLTDQTPWIVAHRMFREIDHMLDLMAPADLMRFFGFNKKQRRYICPRCYWDSDREGDIGYPRTAQLKPNTPASVNLYCFVCSNDIPVLRKNCGTAACKGNVINEQDDQECLTCFGA